MPEISLTGKNLVVIVACEYLPGHSWMSLASWYSMRKNLPDAKVLVGCSRRLFGRPSTLFEWAYRLRVPLFYFDPEKGVGRDADVVVPVTSMAVRTWDKERPGPASVKSAEHSTFVDYGDGCGRFIPVEWLNKGRGPFKNAVKRLGTQESTPNELKVLRLWERLYRLYTAI